MVPQHGSWLLAGRPGALRGRGSTSQISQQPARCRPRLLYTGVGMTPRKSPFACHCSSSQHYPVPVMRRTAIQTGTEQVPGAFASAEASPKNSPECSECLALAPASPMPTCLGQVEETPLCLGIWGLPGQGELLCPLGRGGRANPSSSHSSREMLPFGVKVCMIEPGYFRTAITEAGILTENFKRLWELLPQETKAAYGEQYLESCEYPASRALPAQPCFPLPFLRAAGHRARDSPHCWPCSPWLCTASAQGSRSGSSSPSASFNAA